MFEKKNKDPNELDAGEINLLPEDMRSAAEKFRRSRKEDRAYQLRAPKKERKRRRFFVWLPFFGGSHWEVTGPVNPLPKPSVPKISDTVAVDTAVRGGPLQQPMTGSANEFKIITPIGSSTGTSVGTPKAKRSFKGGILLRSLFGRKRPVVPQRSAPVRDTVLQPQAPVQFTPPSRHYSLLDEDTRERAGIVPKPSIQPVAPTVPVIDTAGGPSFRPITPQAVTAPAVPKIKKSWQLPRWLDIFAWIGLFSRRPKSRPAPAIVSQAHVAQPSTAGSAPTRTYSPRPLEAVKESPVVQVQYPVNMPAPLTPVAQDHPVQHVREERHSQVIPSVPMPPRVPKARHPWQLPKWLDIFYLLGFLRMRRRSKIQPMKAPVAPITTLEPAKPEPVKPSQAMQQPVTPIPVPTSSFAQFRPIDIPGIKTEIPAIPSAVPTPMTPQPRPVGAPSPVSAPAVSNDIKPIADVAAPTSKKKLAKGGDGLFHMPTRSKYASVSRELRDINLIPGAFAVSRSWKQIVQLVVVAILATSGVIGLVYGGLYLFRQQLDRRTAEIDADINAFRDDILVYNKQEPEMSNLGMRIDLVAQLLGQHIYWTNFFDLLERYTVSDVYYDGISATTNGNLSLSAHGSSFETVSQQLLLLNSAEAKEFVTEASITGAQLAQASDQTEQVNFSIELTLNPKLFYYATVQ